MFVQATMCGVKVSLLGQMLGRNLRHVPEVNRCTCFVSLLNFSTCTVFHVSLQCLHHQTGILNGSAFICFWQGAIVTVFFLTWRWRWSRSVNYALVQGQKWVWKAGSCFMKGDKCKAAVLTILRVASRCNKFRFVAFWVMTPCASCNSADSLGNIYIYIYEWVWSIGGMMPTRDTEVLGENLAPLSLCPPQIPHGLGHGVV